jgi:hypothetical protein
MLLRGMGRDFVKYTENEQVLFTDQHGHHVSHNPGTLRHKEEEK